MSVFMLYSTSPLPGKRQLLESRLRKAMSIADRKGAKETCLRMNRIGENAGNLFIVAEFEGFQHATTCMNAVWQDEEFKEMNVERDKDPAGIPVGPLLLRDVCGNPIISAPAHLARTYRLPRAHLSKAIDLLDQVSSLSEEISVCGVLPVLSPEMDTMVAVYQFESMEDAGRLTDQVGMSSEFQQIVSQASELGTLIRSGLNVRL